MELWEFLLQKEGEVSWFPVKIPNLQLEEGNYQIYAKSSRINTDVEIRVAFSNASQSSLTKYYRRSNKQGLMLILPLTYLYPGVWELLCRGDLVSDLFGESWQVTLVLQVGAKQLTEPLLETPAQPFLIADQLDKITPQPEVLTAETVKEKKSTENPIKLSLSQDSYVMDPDNSVEISGTVDSEEQEFFKKDSFAGTLYYQLRDPQTGEILLNVKQDLAVETLPLSFSCTLEIPDKWRTCLILGEVILEFIAYTHQGSNYTVNRSQSFRIVAQSKKIVETLEYIEAVSTWKRTRHNRKKKRLELPDTSTAGSSVDNLRPSTGRILPPRLTYRTKEIQPLDLPEVVTEKNNLDDPNSHMSNIDQKFESLKVGDRFWSRLSDLAENPE